MKHKTKGGGDKKHNHKFNYVDYLYVQKIVNDYDIFVNARFLFICECGEIKLIKARKDSIPPKQNK
jgi:hypothetical protein